MSLEKPNYTQVPNVILDEIIKELNLAELKILLVITRKTCGWHKDKDAISYSQIHEITGLGKQHISRGIKNLIAKDLILRMKNGKGRGQSQTFELNIDEKERLPNVTNNENNGYQTLPIEKNNGNQTLPISQIIGNQREHTKESNINKTSEEKKDEAKKISHVTNGKPVSDDVIRLTQILIELILKNNPQNVQLRNGKAELTDKKWAMDIDKMIRIDGRYPDEIELVIRWSQSDTFWHRNILSADALRKQYDRLLMQMKPKQHYTDTPIEDRMASSVALAKQMGVI